MLHRARYLEFRLLYRVGTAKFGGIQGYQVRGSSTKCRCISVPLLTSWIRLRLIAVETGLIFGFKRARDALNLDLVSGFESLLVFGLGPPNPVTFSTRTLELSMAQT